jgi:hypothetical protein
MSCMKRGKYFQKLYQDGIDAIGTDQALFRFMHRQIERRQGRIRKAFSFESIRGMYLVKVSHIIPGYSMTVLSLTKEQVRSARIRVRRCASPPSLCDYYIAKDM